MPRLWPHRHADEGVAAPRVQLCDHVALSQPLRERDRSLVVNSGVVCREEPHGLVAGGETELQRRFVEPACQGMPGELRSRRALCLQRLHGPTVENAPACLARFAVDHIANLVVGKDVLPISGLTLGLAYLMEQVAPDYRIKRG